jgi:hypothetical protein
MTNAWTRIRMGTAHRDDRTLRGWVRRTESSTGAGFVARPPKPRHQWDGHVVHITHPGFWFGFAPPQTGTPRRLTVIARTDAWLAVVRAKQLHGLLKTHPEWWRHLAVAMDEYTDIAADASSGLMSNVSRNTLGTFLRSLRDAGLISIRSGKTRPLQPGKLRALVEAA